MPSRMLVGLQAALAAYLVLGGPLVPSAPVLRLAEAGGVALAGWALAYIRPRNLRIGPEPAREARLVTGGPYRWVRHPMYGALLLVAASMTAARPSTDRCMVLAALAAVLVLKIDREEQLLRRRFPGYAEYAAKTRRLVPGIF